MQKTLVCDIQRFSVHDGPGIRTTVFFKGCPLRCRWCQNPETLKFENELVFNADRCIACGDCAKACPNGAIRFENGPVLIRSLCQTCFTCADVCPSRALEPAAREYSPEELARIVLADREFWEVEGGVTLSGGEPLARPDFLKELIPLLKGEKIHVAAQTCGYFNWDALAPVIGKLDLILFDIKAINPVLHQDITGKELKRILENLENIIRAGIPHQIRIPVVPGLNDADEELEKTARFIKDLGETEVWLLPYHRLGESKLKKLDTEMKPLGIKSPPDSYLAEKANLFLNQGLTVKSFKFILMPIRP